MKAVYAITSLMIIVLFLSFVPNVALSEDVDTSSIDREGEITQGRITHLNVRVGDIVNLESFCIPNDNSLDNQFYYDRQINAPFSIPEGFSFVVTDIIVYPDCRRGFPPDPSYFTLALVEEPIVDRKFTAQFSGKDVRNFSFTGGFAYPAGSVPRPRNTTFSGDSTQIQLLGYFIRGTALAPGKPRF